MARKNSPQDTLPSPTSMQGEAMNPQHGRPLPPALGGAVNALEAAAVSYAQAVAQPLIQPDEGRNGGHGRAVPTTNPDGSMSFPGGFVPASKDPAVVASGMPPDSTHTSYTTANGGGWITPADVASIIASSPTTTVAEAGAKWLAQRAQTQ